ncbi:MAG: iron-sulfur cluster assembly scaffold protein [Longispora sp.]|nr:iron-sulfur cluster assembly scaffold protein [Longispora sp. (in: high G+C Gram-positive bacteria)]
MVRYSSVVIDHFTNPRNCGTLPDADVRAFIGNPVCGDQILLSADIAGDVVRQVQFQAFGCSASLAVASLLTTVLRGKPLEDAEALDATRIEELAGGLAPEHRHVAVLGADVVYRLVDNYRQGDSDDDPADSSP